jgi:hypothetical protein
MNTANSMQPMPAWARTRAIATPQGKRIQPKRRQTNWIQWFILLQIVCQLVLLTSLAAGPFRVIIRVAAFGVSLLFLVLLPRTQGKPHPAAWPAIGVMVILLVEFFHPTTNNTLSGIAQIALYLAILAPLFWAPRLSLDRRALRAVLLTLWGFHALSASFGILQVYVPGKFQPELSTVVAAKGSGYVQSLSMKTSGGHRVLRPMGLTDTPGGAATSGFYVVLLGVGFLLTERRMLLRAVFVAGMFLGMTCLYLCLIRGMIVVLACCVISLMGMLALRGSRAKLTTLIMILACVIMVSFFWAVSVGGAVIVKRLASITTKSPTETYYKNRGVFLDYTVNELLPKYPLGAGLGRWGMVNTYFADKSKPGIWAEIQWTAWLLDGGVPLTLAYLVTLGVALATMWKIALRRDIGDLWLWGAVMLAYNVGAVANTFSYPLFASQPGMEFWMLNAAVFAVARSYPTEGQRGLTRKSVLNTRNIAANRRFRPAPFDPAQSTYR